LNRMVSPQGLLQALKDAVGPDACDAAFQIPIAVRHNTFSISPSSDIQTAPQSAVNLARHHIY